MTNKCSLCGKVGCEHLRITKREYEKEVLKNMTKDEFEKEYARKSGMTVEELHKMGLYAKECDCEYNNCKGWQMVNLKI